MMPEKSQTRSWLLWLLILMTMRKSHATTAKIIRVSKASGESVVLPSDLLMEMLETGADVRWSSPHMLLRNKISTCQHGRCELTVNKSLNFSRVQVEDSGNYTLEVFDKHGNIEEKKVFVLQVEATTAKIIRVSKASGESVVLPSDLLMEMLETGADVRWSSPHMLLRKKISTCQHGRCGLTVNKSLNFSRVQVEDSGNYTLEVFDKHGNIEEKKVFVLQVEDPSSHGGPSLQLLFLLLPIIVFFLMMMMMIMRRRRRKRTVQISGQTEENVYMAMHAHHGNEGKQEKEQEKESFHEVPQHPAAPEELVEDIYV